MMEKILVIVLVVACVGARPSHDPLLMYRERIGEMIYDLESGKVEAMADKGPAAVQSYITTLKKINASDEILEAWVQHISVERDDPHKSGQEFWGESEEELTLNCDMTKKYRSDSRPTSVHKLRPGDIDLIGAMGDSITAGFGADASFITPWAWFYEYRGNSWSVGGDHSFSQGYTTLPNILKEFNPNLRGFSEGVIENADRDERNPVKVNLNVAITGSRSWNMSEQAQRLVSTLRNDPDYDMENDWKMITLFIGGNNLCDFCKDLDKHSAATYKADIEKALDILKANVPRLYINLVEILDIAPLAEVADFTYGVLVCSFAHKIADVCSCVRDQDDYNYKYDPKALGRLSGQYRKAANELALLDKYNDKDDFTIVIQPFLRDVVPPVESDGTPDRTYFAQDCFHFSLKGHKRVGRGLWNSIVEPVGSKPTLCAWDKETPAACPKTEYLPTRKNSA